MTFTVLLRRSATPGHMPTSTQLNVGELSVNSYDGILYYRQSNSTANTVLALSPFLPALTANALTTAVNISVSGDATGTVPFNGSSNVTIATTLATVNNTVGTFGTTSVIPTVTVNAKGLVTNVSNSAIAFPVTSVGGSTGAVTGGTFGGTVAFTGISTAVTQSVSDNSTMIATTGFVYALGTIFQSLALQISGGTATGQINLSGGATSVTPATTDNSTKVATTAFVVAKTGNYLPLTGGSLSGMLTAPDINIDATLAGSSAPAVLNLNANSANIRVIETDTATVPRIRFGASDATESGSNMGSNFYIETFSDSGVALSNALTLFRSNGVLAVTNTITTVTQATSDNTTNVATTAFVQSNLNSAGRQLTTYSGTGSQTTFAIPAAVTANDLIVSVGGNIMNPSVDYSVSGTTLTFAVAPDLTTVIWILLLGVTVSVGSGGYLLANVNANITASWTFSQPIIGTAVMSYGADLAERYASDAIYETGTVVVFGGDNEVTACETDSDHRVAGVVSDQPAYTMNQGAGEDASHPRIALVGRVPCKVVGIVNKGDLLVTSAIKGHARAISPADVLPCTVIGKSLNAKYDTDAGIIEVALVR